MLLRCQVLICLRCFFECKYLINDWSQLRGTDKAVHCLEPNKDMSQVEAEALYDSLSSGTDEDTAQVGTLHKALRLKIPSWVTLYVFTFKASHINESHGCTANLSKEANGMDPACKPYSIEGTHDCAGTSNLPWKR